MVDLDDTFTADFMECTFTDCSGPTRVLNERKGVPAKGKTYREIRGDATSTHMSFDRVHLEHGYVLLMTMTGGRHELDL